MPRIIQPPKPDTKNPQKSDHFNGTVTKPHLQTTGYEGAYVSEDTGYDEGYTAGYN